MGLAAAVGFLGVGMNLAGTLISTSAQSRMVAEETAASKQAENAREQQMQLQAQAQRRASVRQAIVARSQALTVGTAQGAGYGSGVAAAEGQAIGTGLENQYMTNSSEILGGRVFDANRAYFEAQQRGQSGMALGAGLSSLGGALVSAQGLIGKIGGNLFGSNVQAAAPVAKGPGVTGDPWSGMRQTSPVLPQTAPIPTPNPYDQPSFVYGGL